MNESTAKTRGQNSSKLDPPQNGQTLISSQLQNAVLNFQEANALRGASRAQKLRATDTELRKLRLYLRLCEKWEWITSNQYPMFSK